MPQASGAVMKTASTVVLVILFIAVAWHRNHQPGSFSKSPPPNAAVSANGFYNLERDEQAGGHTLRRHVGRTDDQLRERVGRERDISAASTYTDQASAE